MGQYYEAVILASADAGVILAWLSALSFCSGQKLMEHSYMDNPFMAAVEHLLSPMGRFYKSRLVWAGDYADREPDSDKNLFHMVDKRHEIGYVTGVKAAPYYRYIVNHSKRLYVDKSRCVGTVHPLSLLTADGSGRGGGDYEGSNEDLIGTWARDVISMETHLPLADGLDYCELTCEFKFKYAQDSASESEDVC
jgi:hypothetical protein